MIPDGFVEALIQYGDAGLGGISELEDQFETLYGLMKSGNGLQLVSSAINGKNFGWHSSMTVEEAFGCYARALKELKGTSTPVTYASFYGITR